MIKRQTHEVSGKAAVILAFNPDVLFIEGDGVRSAATILRRGIDITRVRDGKSIRLRKQDLQRAQEVSEKLRKLLA